MAHPKRRAIVCGTKFGRIYLKAFTDPDLPFELAGILGQGSARTMACAERYGVPVYQKVDDLPDDIQAACVVIGSGVGGGPGADLAQALMRRGIHVLQEHPLLPAEIAACLRTAAAAKVQYHLNTHYVTLTPVRAFIAAARRMVAHGRPVFIDAACSIQVAYTLFDILGEALGGLRPWAFAAAPEWSDQLARLSASPPPYRNVEGVLAGIPMTLRVQNELDPDDPDNFSHMLHRITIGGDGGCLTLVDTHGPVIWTPRLHLPASARKTATIDEAPDSHLDLAALTAADLSSASHRHILGSVWPQGVAHALRGLHEAIETGASPMQRGQYQLAVCETWQSLTRAIGFPNLRTGTTLPPLPATSILDHPLTKVDA
ncbi:Gfo/Idh/MocA family oxidoreductase [Paracoccus caeni]|uniref:Gfo/Idh/MocA family oxidoreductase n=1 Tax=Paracoccus caeni TaxID=657651 RepID=A0A934SHR1_9RHOB|nr:Gfo/Idh/MocA family oxidoreductase [Paracoccus caeni]MBK4217868.1 Gfo/Idh/MocA family oxidoreductase [Paracoccus caeni]